MVNSAHPLAVDPQAVRLLEHTLLHTEELLSADSFSLDGDVVIFRRRASAHGPATTWQGRLGDWLVRDGSAHWRIVSDDAMTLGPTVSERT
jgi:hypothetical protein